MPGRIPTAFIDDLLARTEIVEVIDARVPLRKQGHEYSGLCPFHSEKTPSFTVSPAKQFYHCFGCGAHGTAIGFLMQFEHMGFVEAIDALAARAGMEVPHEGEDGQEGRGPSLDPLYAMLEQANGFYQRQLRDPTVGRAAVEYLKARGLSGEVCARFQVGYAPPGWDRLAKALGGGGKDRRSLVMAGLLAEKGERSYDRFRDRIMFPIRDIRGRVLGFGGRVLGEGEPKYLNSPETPTFHKGKELYGQYEVRKALRKIERVVVVEGYMDVVSLAQYGLANVVATLGTATTAEHARRLFLISPEIVFCFDGDPAGRAAAWKALETALPMMRGDRQVRFLLLPEREDPDSLIRTEGKVGFETRMAQAPVLWSFFFERFAKEIDLSEIDGPARYVEQVRPYLQRLPVGVYREMMYSRLAERAGVERSRLEPGGAATARSQSPRQGREFVLRRGAPSAVRTAISLLLRDPRRMGALAGDPKRLLGSGLPGVGLLVELLELVRSQPGITTAAILLERWRGTEEGRHLEELAQSEWDSPLSEAALGKELEGALDQIELRRIEQREQALLRGGVARLSESEKTEWRALSAKRETIKRRLRSQGEPQEPA
jgi:DNA primase